MAASGSTPEVPPVRPLGIRVAGLVLALEAVALLGFGIAEIVSAQPGRIMVGVGAGAVLLVYGFGLGLVARGLLRVRRWSRGPAVATQLIHLPVAWNFRSGDLWWVAVLLAVVAVVVLVGLLLPSSTAALVRPAETHED